MLFLIGRRSRPCLAARGVIRPRVQGPLVAQFEARRHHWSDYEPIISSHSLGTGRKAATAPNGEVRGCAKYLRKSRLTEQTVGSTLLHSKSTFVCGCVTVTSPHLPLPLPPPPAGRHRRSRGSRGGVWSLRIPATVILSCPVLCRFPAL